MARRSKKKGWFIPCLIALVIGMLIMDFVWAPFHTKVLKKIHVKDMNAFNAHTGVDTAGDYTF
jgi:hypothetical protein